VTGPGCFLFRENNVFLLPVVACSAVIPLTIRLYRPDDMPLCQKYCVLCATVLLSGLACADCLRLDEAKKHVGEIKCISGTVVRVKQGSGGVHFLDFCDDFRLCPFTVVVFPSDLKSIGDVRQLAAARSRSTDRLRNTTAGQKSSSRNTGSSAAQARESLLCRRITTWRKGAASAPGPSAIRKLERRRPRSGSQLLCRSRFPRIRTDGLKKVEDAYLPALPGAFPPAPVRSPTSTPRAVAKSIW